MGDVGEGEGGGVSGCDTINGGPGGVVEGRVGGVSLSLFKGRINKEMSL